MVSRLAGLGISLAFTAPIAGFLYMLGRDPKGGAHLHQTPMLKPARLAVGADDRLVVSGGFHLLEMANVLAADQRVNNTFDACYTPRKMHMTGLIEGRDVGVGPDGTPLFVSSRFNCVVRPDPAHSFAPHWQPDFISGMVDEDRCHLTGLATDGDTGLCHRAGRIRSGRQLA